ncbi:MAG: bifunctional folylpolyglutamate synthase/dihydrofolate synthase, partial [Nitrospiraceae bacterium]|nr:bifunctional folylpolyglutamate synthase/dihydrofolate synthase [Nitrospiraceae bacterium]
MSYAAALQFLYGLQKHGVKLGLQRMSSLLERLGDPHRRYPVCHIGGTNGKGSTAAMAASMLQAAGYRVGLYTSPHLVAFNERIRVAGHPIEDEQIAALTEQIRKASGPITDLTFFEFTTAIAFQHFAQSHLDVAVVEVGMGGRYDATNVVMPMVSTITNVALDHQAYLGDTVDAIAVEKAGIIKCRTPVVVGRLSSDASTVIDSVALGRHASVFRLNVDFHADGESEASFRYEGMKRLIGDLSCPLPGVHQLENAACAIAMIELASERGLAVSDAAIRSGLAVVQWEGRLQVLEQQPRL